MSYLIADRIRDARRDLNLATAGLRRTSEEAEGGCGVLGLTSNILIAGRHVIPASAQMHNRGNGKGGGIAMAGLDPAQARVDADTLKSHYLLQVALLDASARREVEDQFIIPHFEIAQSYALDHADDHRSIEGLDIRPPDVMRYFVRVKPHVLAEFAEDKGLEGLAERAVEDEFVYQNSFRLNQQFYASLGDQRAFVLSHGRDLVVLKIVGYAEQVVDYYRLHDQTAHVWIAHQRYPTKGRVWHPGGAHPFIGLNEALVHNGDFANYYAVSEYLRQHNISQQFLTDTEVGVQMFDLLDRVYGYPLEATLEALAPTTEHDFNMLPESKQAFYRAIQSAHIHASPDGPWFFIIARSRPDEDRAELIGITDTSMLRPQVFALYENDTTVSNSSVQIGLIASERQAINACMRSLASEDDRFQPVADHYWAARGGSYTDGGAFSFSYSPQHGLICTNKFGQRMELPKGKAHQPRLARQMRKTNSGKWVEEIRETFAAGGATSMFDWARDGLQDAAWEEVRGRLHALRSFAGTGPDEWHAVFETHNLLRDRVLDLGSKKRASVLALVDGSLSELFGSAPRFSSHADGDRGAAYLVTWNDREILCQPAGDGAALILDTTGFPADGDECAARWIVQAYQSGWSHVIAFNWRGGRFAACGLGPDTSRLRIDLYGDVGDYAASGIDGAQVTIHGDAQDQVGQILRNGRLVIHGDVGQTFLYGAKGGEIFVRGSAAGRPLINAVGRPRAVINGTCLDYLAESFMAGNVFEGGGFVILNGVTFDADGKLVDLPSPYPGGNIFSLASGGAIYLRDPHRILQADQLNGGVLSTLTTADWALIEPYLRENERLFGIRIADLLTVDGHPVAPQRAYRKVSVYTSDLVLETENR